MFIDSHAHIDGPEFDADRELVIQRAHVGGVSTILNVGTGDPNTGVLERAVALGEQHQSIYTALGVHPHDARFYDETVEQQIKNLLSRPRVIAWGEIGLDFHYDNSPRQMQLNAFGRQLRAARESNLPVVIHTREAEIETIETLKSEYGDAQRRGVFHCFSGSSNLARQALDLGFMISFSGIVTFKKAEELRETARQVPLDCLLLETDCPFLAPIPYRGKRNEPAYVVEVARCLADLRGTHLNEMAHITSENFSRLFGLELS
jgi:TatD DNase family protein